MNATTINRFTSAFSSNSLHLSDLDHPDAGFTRRIRDVLRTESHFPEGFNVPPHFVGRFQRGVSQDQLDLLSGEPGKKLSWVFGHDAFSSFAGMNHTQAMLAVGFSKSWLRKRLDDGTQHRLVIFPCSDDELVLGTWDNMMKLIKIHYGEEVHSRLFPHLEKLKAFHIKRIDPKLSVEDKLIHSEFYSVDKLMKLSHVSLYDARGFFYHTMGCNYLFIGKGHSRDPDGKDRLEYLLPNRRIHEIPHAYIHKIEIDLESIINEHEGRILTKYERCQEVANKFKNREVIRSDSTLVEGILGRFIRGRVPEDFENLSDESANLVFGGDTIRELCGLSVPKALLSLGFSKAYLARLYQEGYSHKLVLFPEPMIRTHATWDEIFSLVKEVYGSDIYEKLLPHLPALKLKHFTDIKGVESLKKVSNLHRQEKENHPDYFSPEKIRSIESVSLLEARGFFYHSIRCNQLFEGMGYTRARNGDDRAEFLVLNSKVANIQDVVVVDVKFSFDELEDA
ncbi:hypothetical protein HDU79_011230 [Rhizoclosmatium sp. JEL0117]|nr:hypothetical protein HDU79_011230 [Rhizoclosmatium sp. JEL0117]